jgi:hypothetical protein
MSSCQGELPNRPFSVRAIDKNGKILVDETVTTLRNGFFEMWLPRDRTIMLQVKGLNRKALGGISTYDNSKTCVTTFRLQ